MLSVSTFLSWFWMLYFRKRLSVNGLTVFLLSVLHTFLGVASVKIFAFLEGTPGGMSLYGAIFFMPLIYALGAKLSKRKMSEVFDIFTPCIIFAMLMARFNCLRGGCCLGTLIPGTDGLRWPTRETEIVFYIILGFFLGRAILKNKTRGRAYPIYMMCYGVFRFIIEFFRENAELWGVFHISHIWSVISAAVGTAAFIVINKKLKTKNHIREQEKKG